MNTTCGTCTRQLVMLAYERSFWFRLVREPLKFAMRSWARLASIAPDAGEPVPPVCRDCMRFYKNALKSRSPLFRRLNDLINPPFDKVLERIVGPQAILDAKHMAATRDRSDPPANPARWTRI